MSRSPDDRLSLVRGASWVAIAVLMAACWDDDPCDPGQMVAANHCVNAPSAGGSGGTGGGDAGAPDTGAGATDESNFGKPCSTAADCSGDAPVCGQPYATYCTQRECGPGEAHADVCPEGWQCLMIPGVPSVCSQL
jgi:hypothetical protein